MQSKVLLAVFSVGAFLTCCPQPLHASGFDDKTIDQQSINALQAKILLAQPREQCFLYAQLLHEMTEFSLHQYSAGEDQKAAGLLKQVQGLAHKIHASMSEDNKRLK